MNRGAADDAHTENICSALYAVCSIAYKTTYKLNDAPHFTSRTLGNHVVPAAFLLTKLLLNQVVYYKHCNSRYMYASSNDCLLHVMHECINELTKCWHIRA